MFTHHNRYFLKFIKIPTHSSFAVMLVPIIKALSGIKCKPVTCDSSVCPKLEYCFYCLLIWLFGDVAIGRCRSTSKSTTLAFHTLWHYNRLAPVPCPSRLQLHYSPVYSWHQKSGTKQPIVCSLLFYLSSESMGSIMKVIILISPALAPLWAGLHKSVMPEWPYHSCKVTKLENLGLT